jgi:glycine cleavage system pyridoxal-binding protein P
MSALMALQTVKSGMRVIISSCSHKTFYAEYSYNGCKPDVKKAIIKWAAGGAGIRAAARELSASADTVIKELKKENLIEHVNKEYLESHKNITIRVEMDGMRSFYHDKKRQIWLWRAVGHETGVAVAFWFGTREHKNLDKLIELLRSA